MRWTLLVALCGAMVCGGCADDAPDVPSKAPRGVVLGLESEPGSEPSEPETSSGEASPHAPVTPVSQGESTLLPVVEPMRRARQRMTIPQLSAALTQVTGGIGWTEMYWGLEVDLFEVFAASLGVPDYLETTREDLATSALFHKFLDEAARYACSALVAREVGGEPFEAQLMAHASPEDTINSAPEAIDANLRYLLLRYHGRKLVGDAPALNAWRWLFESVTHVSGDPAIGWRAVCIGLVTHPDFYSF